MSQTEATANGSLTTSGWCAHGVPYGPNWHCAACGSPQPTSFSIPPREIDHELHRKLNRIIALLEQIAGIAR